VVKLARNRDRDFKTGQVPRPRGKPKNAGAFVETETKAVPEQQGFTTEDILWAVGIWSVILTLSPVVVFYMLMVA
jgi:hypothetical protein